MVLGSLVFVALLAGSASAQDSPSYVCAPSESTGTSCQRRASSDASRERCSLACFYDQDRVCFCRAYGTGSQPASNPDDGVGISGGFRFGLAKGFAEEIEKEAGKLVLRFLAWPIPKSLGTDGPHEVLGQVSVGDAIYDFTGEIRIHGGVVNIRYDVEGHPEISTVRAEIGSPELPGEVLVTLHDGSGQKIVFDGLEGSETLGPTPPPE